MRTRLLHILCLFVLAAPENVSAQDLPALGKASEITSGKLPDGLSYYLVKNSSTPGYADYALVQKHCTEGKVNRDALSSLPHFPGRKPWKFLSDNAIGYAPYGIGYSAGATVTKGGEKGSSIVYRFRNVPVFNQAVADSTLLMLFDLAQSSEYDQALVVSGDINVSTVTDRMGMLSMLVPSRKSVVLAETHSFQPTASAQFEFIVTEGLPIATAEVFYKSPRTAAGSRNTMLPIVSETMALQLGRIAAVRMKRLMAAEGIPCAGISYSYSGVGKSDADEGLRLKVSTAPGHIEEACACLSSVLSDIDANGAGLQEIKDARDHDMAILNRDAPNMKWTNSHYLDKCLSAYLYGTNLAPYTAVRDFYKDRNLDPEVEKNLFNKYASAMLDREKNLTVTFSAPELGGTLKTALERKFRQAWDECKPTSFDLSGADTLKLINPKKKTKIKISSTDPTSGGELWTFANGVKVVFKKDAAQKGKFHFSYMVKGGISGIKDLRQGESPFADDMIPLFKVAGISGEDFSRMLDAGGIDVSWRISQSDVRFNGLAPSSRLQLALKSIVTFATDRKTDPEAFESYIQGEELRIRIRRRSTEGLCEVLDSIMSPGYVYLNHKQLMNLQEDLPERVNSYLDQQFANTGNTLIVLIGDLNKEETQKQLCRYLGELHSSSQRPVRPKSSFNLENWWLTLCAPSEKSVFGEREKSVNVAVCAKMPFNTDNNAAFKLAAEAVEREIIKEMGPMGMTAYVKSVESEDRLSLYVVCRHCRQAGLPSGVGNSRETDVLNAVRYAINRFNMTPLSDSELKSCKSAVTNKLNAITGDPSFIVDAVVARNSEGRDELTNYKSRIGAVPLSLVRSVLTNLSNGSKVEYIVL